MPRRPRPIDATERATRTREQILRAAADCFAKEGYRATRMTSIAEAVGISRARLYQHFPGKAELLLALNEYLISEWRVWTQESVALARTSCEAIEHWLRGGLSDPWRIIALRALSAEDAEGEFLMEHGATRDALDETARVLSMVLERGIAEGELRADLDVEATAHALQATLLGHQRNFASDRPIIAVERGRDLDALIDLVLRGLRAPDTRA